MEEILRDLLADLAAIAERHEEINDSDVEEAMTAAIFEGFLKPAPGFSLPEEFGMYSEEGNALLRSALARYLQRAVPLAAEQGLDFHDRLSAFQNRTCTVGPSRLGYNDFFRYLPPKRYDELGNPT